MTIPAIDIPIRVKSLPKDDRGYPIPYFVAWVEGKPDFRIVDPEKVRNCVRFEVCWICGQPLGRFKVFALGPAATVSAASAEPPSHRDCVAYAVRVCPFMLHPQSKRREANLPPSTAINADVMPGNPGITFLWTTKQYRVGRHFTLPYDHCDGLEGWRQGQRVSPKDAWAVYAPALRTIEETGLRRIASNQFNKIEVIKQFNIIKKESYNLFTAQFGSQPGIAENTNAEASASN